MVKFLNVAPFFAGFSFANPTTSDYTMGVDTVYRYSTRNADILCKITAPSWAINHLAQNTNWADAFNCEYVDSNDNTVCVIETSWHVSLSFNIGFQCDEVEYGQGPGATTTTAAPTTTAEISEDKSLTFGQNCGKYSVKLTFS